MSKVFLALLDGMRPDSLTAGNHPFYQELLKTGRYSMNMQAVVPSVTLPCHMSLFHGVTAGRHGILTNTYVPQVRPVRGICEVLAAAGKTSALFYTWEALRDLALPHSITRGSFVSGPQQTFAVADRLITEDAEKMLASGNLPDFIFFYQGQPDEAGHKYGWMTDEYMQAISESLDNVQRIAARLPPEYHVILTADHGGHDRTHGTELPEDMTIPFFMRHASLTPGEMTGNTCITDIAPTITSLLGLAADPDWEGRAL